jgi:hypothetical protein
MITLMPRTLICMALLITMHQGTRGPSTLIRSASHLYYTRAGRFSYRYARAGLLTRRYGPDGRIAWFRLIFN